MKKISIYIGATIVGLLIVTALPIIFVYIGKLINFFSASLNADEILFEPSELPLFAMLGLIIAIPLAILAGVGIVKGD